MNAVKYAIDFAALCAAYFIFFFNKWKNAGKYHLAVNTVMYVYLSFVVSVTLTPVIASLPHLFDHPYKPMFLELFGDYLAGRGDTVRQIVLNVLMMVPCGFLLPLVKPQRLWSSALWTFALSLAIELIQPLMTGGRASDITDLVTNTAGGILGYLLFTLLKKPLLKALDRLK